MTAAEMKAKLDELNEQHQRISSEISQLEQDYALAACPWTEDTVLEDTTDGKRYIVEKPIFYRGDWAAVCTRIRKDGFFGSRTEIIEAHHADCFNVMNGVKITESGIVRTTEEKLARWQDATAVAAATKWPGEARGE